MNIRNRYSFTLATCSLCRWRNESALVEGRLDIVGVIPGDEGYDDFWLVNKVTVPRDHVASTVGSVARIMDAGVEVEATTEIINCDRAPGLHGARAARTPA